MKTLIIKDASGVVHFYPLANVNVRMLNNILWVDRPDGLISKLFNVNVTPGELIAFYDNNTQTLFLSEEVTQDATERS